ncbi:MAG: hypothetical protein DHS20C14_15510 [Phycisphaeraceae bacterium]|nr:MAG: hypothetical protein DHS20C14_15510 [Phycisphaeraceae bacterium]
MVSGQSGNGGSEARQDETSEPPHCCGAMKQHLQFRCGTHADPYECPDTTFHYNPRFREHGIIVHDGGTSMIVIEYCPFCGAKLPESKRDEWFDALESRGIDPENNEFPEEFEDDRWWRQAKGP